MNKAQDIIDDALAGINTHDIAYSRKITQQQVRKVLRRERERLRLMGFNVPSELFAGRVKVESTKQRVPREQLWEHFKFCAIMRVEPKYAELAQTHGISVRSVKREQQEWRASGYTVLAVPTAAGYGHWVPPSEPESDKVSHQFSPEAADKIAALGPDRVLSDDEAFALSLAGAGSVHLPVIPRPLLAANGDGTMTVLGYEEMLDDASRLPNQKEVLIFAGMLFTVLILLLYFFTPGA